MLSSPTTSTVTQLNQPPWWPFVRHADYVKNLQFHRWERSLQWMAENGPLFTNKRRTVRKRSIEWNRRIQLAQHGQQSEWWNWKRKTAIYFSALFFPPCSSAEAELITHLVPGFSPLPSGSLGIEIPHRFSLFFRDAWMAISFLWISPPLCSHIFRSPIFKLLLLGMIFLLPNK